MYFAETKRQSTSLWSKETIFVSKIEFTHTKVGRYSTGSLRSIFCCRYTPWLSLEDALLSIWNNSFGITGTRFQRSKVYVFLQHIRRYRTFCEECAHCARARDDQFCEHTAAIMFLLSKWQPAKYDVSYSWIRYATCGSFVRHTIRQIWHLSS